MSYQPRPLLNGTLPSPATIHFICSERFEGLPADFASAAEVHRELQRLLKHDVGACRVLLLRLGFEWVEPGVRA